MLGPAGYMVAHVILVSPQSQLDFDLGTPSKFLRVQKYDSNLTPSHLYARCHSFYHFLLRRPLPYLGGQTEPKLLVHLKLL